MYFFPPFTFTLKSLSIHTAQVKRVCFHNVCMKPESNFPNKVSVKYYIMHERVELLIGVAQTDNELISTCTFWNTKFEVRVEPLLTHRWLERFWKWEIYRLNCVCKCVKVLEDVTIKCFYIRWLHTGGPDDNNLSWVLYHFVGGVCGESKEWTWRLTCFLTAHQCQMLNDVSFSEHLSLSDGKVYFNIYGFTHFLSRLYT